MNTQKAEIREALAEQGWSVCEVPADELEWWADEMWLLESEWSPTDARAFVTFLVDPQASDVKNRKKGASVWAVMASPDVPEDWRAVEGSFTLSLKGDWEESLPDFLEHLLALRRRGEGAGDA